LNGQRIAPSDASTIGAPDARGLDHGDDTQDQNEIPDIASAHVSGKSAPKFNAIIVSLRSK
jgi:hypothetical protein